MYHEEGRLLKMPVCVIPASLQSCNAVMQNQLSFGCQAKTALCYMPGQHDMRNRKAMWLLLSIIMYNNVYSGSSLQQMKSMNLNLIRRVKRKSDFKR